VGTSTSTLGGSQASVKAIPALLPTKRAATPWRYGQAMQPDDDTCRTIPNMSRGSQRRTLNARTPTTYQSAAHAVSPLTKTRHATALQPAIPMYAATKDHASSWSKMIQRSASSSWAW